VERCSLTECRVALLGSALSLTSSQRIASPHSSLSFPLLPFHNLHSSLMGNAHQKWIVEEFNNLRKSKPDQADLDYLVLVFCFFLSKYLNFSNKGKSFLVCKTHFFLT
jgi:hypothetical protein